MSRYSDKVHRVECAWARCEADAVTLKLISGKPVWLCQEHAKEKT